MPNKAGRSYNTQVNGKNTQRSGTICRDILSEPIFFPLEDNTTSSLGLQPPLRLLHPEHPFIQISYQHLRFINVLLECFHSLTIIHKPNDLAKTWGTECEPLIKLTMGDFFSLRPQSFKKSRIISVYS